MSKKNINNILIAIIVVVFILILLPSSTIAKKIEKDTNFHYTTSITSKYSSSDRANVYTTDMSVPDTAQYIMKQKRPLSHTDLNNKECIQLTYDDHYILIYEGENGKTYVQLSSIKYIHRNGYYGLYHPFHRNIVLFYNNNYMTRHYRINNGRYGNGYYSHSRTSTVNNSVPEQAKPKNNSKIRTDNNSSSKIRTKNNTPTKSKSIFHFSSIRSDSVGSRSRLGGGTSFGK